MYTKMDQNLKFNVSLYRESPSGVENISRAIDMAEERLKLYRLFKEHDSLTAPELESHLENSLLKNLLKTDETPQTSEARRTDFIGHWILRAAYSETDSSFFVRNEMRWFKLRYNSMPYDKRGEFLAENKFSFAQPTQEDKLRFKLRRGKWVKMNWTEAVSLVKLRLYPMKSGYIFIPEHKIIYCLLEKFGRSLRKSLIHIRKSQQSWPEQLTVMVSFLDLVKTNDCIVSNPIRLLDLENQVAHFPLCMKFQHENLIKHHHLKHFSRVQYGLFLKGLGLSMGEALEMWKNEFSKKMPKEQFEKNYSYFFKHQYGTVGSKIDYQPQNCDTIIEDSIGCGQINGCPFKHWEKEFLNKRLQQDEIPSIQIHKIFKMKDQKEYKQACTLYFQCTHNCKISTISHPIQYYEKSCRISVIDIEDIFSSDTD